MDHTIQGLTYEAAKRGFALALPPDYHMLTDGERAVIIHRACDTMVRYNFIKRFNAYHRLINGGYF